MNSVTTHVWICSIPWLSAWSFEWIMTTSFYLNLFFFFIYDLQKIDAYQKLIIFSSIKKYFELNINLDATQTMNKFSNCSSRVWKPNK